MRDHLLTLYINGMPVAQTENEGKVARLIFGPSVWRRGQRRTHDLGQ